MQLEAPETQLKMTFSNIVLLITYSSLANLPKTGGLSQEEQLCKYSFPNEPGKAYVCMGVRGLANHVPAAAVLVFALDYWFGIDPQPWDLVKKDVEKLIDEKFDAYTIKSMNQWHQSMSNRVQSCKRKINPAIRLSCYKNLQEDLSGYEPLFRGATTREIAMSIKYYDIFVTTYMSVSHVLRNMSGPALQASIDRDIKFKAGVFANYLKRAVKTTKGYSCRYIKVKLEESYIFWKEDRLVWPKDQDIPKYLDSRIEDVRKELTNSSHKCRYFDTTNTYISKVIDIRDGSEYPGGGYQYKYCRNSLAIADMVPLTFAYWKSFMKMCGDADDKKWIHKIEARLDLLKYV